MFQKSCKFTRYIDWSLEPFLGAVIHNCSNGIFISIGKLCGKRSSNAAGKIPREDVD